jgi:hypothetical protein
MRWFFLYLAVAALLAASTTVPLYVAVLHALAGLS